MSDRTAVQKMIDHAERSLQEFIKENGVDENDEFVKIFRRRIADLKSGKVIPKSSSERKMTESEMLEYDLFESAGQVFLHHKVCNDYVLATTAANNMAQANLLMKAHHEQHHNQENFYDTL